MVPEVVPANQHSLLTLGNSGYQLDLDGVAAATAEASTRLGPLRRCDPWVLHRADPKRASHPAWHPGLIPIRAPDLIDSHLRAHCYVRAQSQQKGRSALPRCKLMAR